MLVYIVRRKGVDWAMQKAELETRKAAYKADLQAKDAEIKALKQQLEVLQN